MKKIRYPVTWGLAVAFAFLTCAGEFLHFLPGCSHYIQQPDGSFFLVGQRESRGAAEEPKFFREASRQAITSESHDDGPPILDAEECTICSFSGLQKQVTANVSPVTCGFLVFLFETRQENMYLDFFAAYLPVRGPPLS